MSNANIRRPTAHSLFFYSYRRSSFPAHPIWSRSRDVFWRERKPLTARLVFLSSRSSHARDSSPTHSIVKMWNGIPHVDAVVGRTRVLRRTSGVQPGSVFVSETRVSKVSFPKVSHVWQRSRGVLRRAARPLRIYVRALDARLRRALKIQRNYSKYRPRGQANSAGAEARLQRPSNMPLNFQERG